MVNVLDRADGLEFLGVLAFFTLSAAWPAQAGFPIALSMFIEHDEDLFDLRASVGRNDCGSCNLGRLSCC